MRRQGRLAGLTLIISYLLFFSLSGQAFEALDLPKADTLPALLALAYDDPNPRLWAEFSPPKPGDGTELGNGRRRVIAPSEVNLDDARAWLADKETKNVMLALHPSMRTAWVIFPVKAPEGELRFAVYLGEPEVKGLTAAATEGQKRVRVLPSVIALLKE